jgi:hypothetical protein
MGTKIVAILNLEERSVPKMGIHIMLMFWSVLCSFHVNFVAFFSLYLSAHKRLLTHLPLCWCPHNIFTNYCWLFGLEWMLLCYLLLIFGDIFLWIYLCHNKRNIFGAELWWMRMLFHFLRVFLSYSLFAPQFLEVIKGVKG